MKKQLSSKSKSVKKPSAAKPKAGAAANRIAKKAKPRASAARPKLLSGGNPQVAKGYGDAPVAAYIAAMPGWKQGVGRRLDAIISRTIPGVHKAVKRMGGRIDFSSEPGHGTTFWIELKRCFEK